MRRVLTIAGSDSSAGAGIQADLKTFSALGVYGTSAITAITAQNTLRVTKQLVMPAELVAAQIEAVLDDIGADAAKTGMLGSAAVVETVSDQLAKHRVANLVVDPVLVASSGERLLEEQGLRLLRERLLPLAMVVTPNLPEAAALVGRSLETAADRRWAAKELVLLGARNVVIKGGHDAGDAAVDLLFDGRDYREFRGPRLVSPNTHGTGCTFSAALAAYLALGEGVPEAVRQAKMFVAKAIAAGLSLGSGPGPVNQFPNSLPFLPAAG